MLGDKADPLALDNEPESAKIALGRYLNDEISLEQAEALIDWDAYTGHEGERHKHLDEQTEQQRQAEREEHERTLAELKPWIRLDIERHRVRQKAKHHKPTNAEYVERAAALFK